MGLEPLVVPGRDWPPVPPARCTCTAPQPAEPVIVNEHRGGTELVGWLCPDCLLETRRPAPAAPVWDPSDAKASYAALVEHADALAADFPTDERGHFAVSTEQARAYQAAVIEATAAKQYVDQLDQALIGAS